MLKTLILYTTNSGFTENIAKQLSLIVGPSRYLNIAEFNKDRGSAYGFVVLGIPTNGNNLDSRMIDFIYDNLSWLKTTPSALYSTSSVFTENKDYLHRIRQILGESVLHTRSIKNNSTTEEIFEYAWTIKELKDNLYKKQTAPKLKKHIDEFIHNHFICTLTSGYNNLIRSVPIEYSYFNECFYMLSVSGDKFANTLLNNKVSLAIYDQSEGCLRSARMEINGTASFVEHDSEEYLKILNMRNVNISKLNKTNVLLHILRIRPEKAVFISSEFNKYGCDTKQEYCF